MMKVRAKWEKVIFYGCRAQVELQVEMKLEKSLGS